MFRYDIYSRQVVAEARENKMTTWGDTGREAERRVKAGEQGEAANGDDAVMTIAWLLCVLGAGVVGFLLGVMVVVAK